MTLDQSHFTAIGTRACLPRTIRLAGIATVFTALSYSARAGDGSSSDPVIADKSGYTLFNPTPGDEMRKFTPDRPAKGFSVRTIDADHIEVEMDTISYTYSKYLRIAMHNVQTIDPNFKIGKKPPRPTRSRILLPARPAVWSHEDTVVGRAQSIGHRSVGVLIRETAAGDGATPGPASTPHRQPFSHRHRRRSPARG